MNIFLLIAGIFHLFAAVAHLGCIYFGASWYRFFGAGEEMATLAERGSIKPTLITFVVVILLCIFALYAFSASGLISLLPFTRYVMLAVLGVFFIRGVLGFFLIKKPMGRSVKFWFWSSSICLGVAFFHLIGLQQQWVYLSR